MVSDGYRGALSLRRGKGKEGVRCCNVLVEIRLMTSMAGGGTERQIKQSKSQLQSE